MSANASEKENYMSTNALTETTHINVDHIVDVPAVIKRDLLITALDVADALDLEIDFSQ